ncbi:MAG: hypothetical protein JXA46_09415 [Dehalococcoidales bacterium]|nr:hypothetical protein [Dehalococcoidales bacterium]
MIALRSLLYVLAIFGALCVIALIVALIMRMLYSILHRGEKKTGPDNKAQSQAISQ